MLAPIEVAKAQGDEAELQMYHGAVARLMAGMGDEFFLQRKERHGVLQWPDGVAKGLDLLPLHGRLGHEAGGHADCAEQDGMARASAWRRAKAAATTSTSHPPLIQLRPAHRGHHGIYARYGVPGSATDGGAPRKSGLWRRIVWPRSTL